MSEESPFKGKTGLRRVWNALHYSMDGLRAAYVGEDAFRQEVLLAAILIERGNTVLAGQLLAQMQPDDELWEFRSPASTWQHLCGREGLVLLRQGKVVAQVLTAMN